MSPRSTLAFTVILLALLFGVAADWLLKATPWGINALLASTLPAGSPTRFLREPPAATTAVDGQTLAQTKIAPAQLICSAASCVSCKNLWRRRCAAHEICNF